MENKVVEVMLPDGSKRMFVGALVSRSETSIVLTSAAWIAHTGRRHLFFAGKPDASCQVEPYPDGVKIELPGGQVIVTDWPYELFRNPR